MRLNRVFVVRCIVAAVVGVCAAGCGQDAEPDEVPDDVVGEPIVDGNVRVTVISPTLLRLEYADDAVFEDRPTQLVGERVAPSAAFETRVEDGFLVVETAALTLRYEQESGPFGDDNLSIALMRGGDEVTVRPEWDPTAEDPEALGGWLRGLDLVSQREELRPGLLSGRGWRLLNDTDTALLVEERPGYAERPERDGAYQDGYFFGFGLDYRQGLADLAHLTGAPPLPPRTAFGVWFSRYYAYTAEEWTGVVDEFESRDVPLDVLSLDTDWKRPAAENFCDAVNSVSGAREDDPCSWNGWDWNYEIFPDPAEFLARIRARGIDVGLNIHPSINAGEPEYPGVEAIVGEMVEDATDPSCQFIQADLSNACYVFDLTDPDHVEAYFGLHDPIAAAGIDFWWFDWCCEGANRSVPGLTSDTWINQLYQREHRELGSRWPAFSRIGSAYEEPPDMDTLLGFFGEGRSTLHFTGDTCSTWELLEFVAEFTVAEGAAGLPFVSHDIGSFHGELLGNNACDALTGSNPRMNDEMYVRWMQFGTFQPFDRLHSNHGDRLPWDYPGRAEEIAAEFLRLRGRLVPHFYTLAREAHDTGMPMARAMYLQWPQQGAAYDFPAQFTLGDDLLIASVAQPGESPSIDVWIPEGTWFNFFSGEELTGPQVVTVDVPLDEYAVFARAGSVLPTQPDLPTSSRGPQDELTLNVWAGGDGSYTLYEDEGVGFGYESGEFARTTVQVSAAESSCATVVIGPAEGEFPSVFDTRTWHVRLVGVDTPASVTLNGTVLDEGGAAAGWTYAGDTRVASIHTGEVRSDTATTVQVCRSDG